MSGSKPVAMQPHVVPAPPRQLGGLTPEVMLFAVLLVLPALWHSIVEGDLPLVVVLERYIFIAVGCAIIATLVQRYSESVRAVTDRVARLDTDAPRTAAAPPVPAVPAAPTEAVKPVAPFDFARSGPDALLDMGSLDDIDALDLLSDESADDLPKTFSLFDE